MPASSCSRASSAPAAAPVAAVLAGLLVNARHLPFGFALAGTAITDAEALGLDAAFPAVLLALVLPSLKDPSRRNPALLGAVVALATTPFLPAGLPVLGALVGLVLLRGRAATETAP